MTLVCCLSRRQPQGLPTAQSLPGSADCRGAHQSETEWTETDQNAVVLVQYICCLSGTSTTDWSLESLLRLLSEGPLRQRAIRTDFASKSHSHRQAGRDGRSRAVRNRLMKSCAWSTCNEMTCLAEDGGRNMQFDWKCKRKGWHLFQLIDGSFTKV